MDHASSPVRLLDVYTKQGIAGLPVRIVRSSGKADVVSPDPSGYLQIRDPETVTALETLDSNWRTVAGDVPAILASEELWLYRMNRIEGRVVFTGGPVIGVGGGDPTRVEITVKHLMPSGPSPAADRSPGSYGWLLSQRMSSLRLGNVVRSDSSFSSRAPRLRGFQLMAKLEGWRTDDVPIVWPADPTRDLAGIEIHLRPAYSVSGRLIAPDGRPLAGAELHIFGSLEGSEESVADAFRNAQIQGMAAGTITRDDGSTEFVTQLRAGTDEEGNFRFYIPVDHLSVRVLAYSPGYAPARVGLGEIGRSQAGIVIEAEDPPSRHAKVTWEGEVLAGHSIDVALADVERAAALPLGETDGDGAVDVSWLELGRVYRLDAESSGGARRHGYLRWDGRSQIRMEALPSSPEGL